MTNTRLVETIKASLVICGLLLAHPCCVAAQEASSAQQEKPAGDMGMCGMMGRGHMVGGMFEMQQMHEQMEKMHEEMSQELQKQMTALRGHFQAMEGISDEQQLLTELKKHQQMTDALLGTMVEQREKMHARMKVHHEQMRSRMGKQPETGTTESEGHEAHHKEE